MHVLRPGHGTAHGYRATRGREENIVRCSGEKGSSCAIVCWSGDCFCVGQVEGQVETKV